MAFCEHYIPNNNDYFSLGKCQLYQKQCRFRGAYPEYNSKNAKKQKQCPDYQEWIDPFKE